MRHINPGILYYMAIGDAYCLGAEYVAEDHPNVEQLLKFEKYISHPKYPLTPGVYTDDTQMSIANSEVLIAGKPYDNIAWANAWVDVFKRDPRKGYSKRFQKYLEEVDTGIDFLKTINPESNKNGAAMRSPVIGVLKTPAEVLKYSKMQAAITHNTPGGIFGAQAVALMSHYALWSYGPMDRLNLGEYLIEHLGKDLVKGEIFKDVIVTPWKGRVAGEEMGINTAWSVFELLVSCDSMLQMLKQTLEWGGDADSIGAIALGIGSCRLEDDLPEFLHTGLERGEYGGKFLKRLGAKLMIKFGT
jgi:ADP-ribosyl-[dinitrogen reductase] hydrolase